MLVKYLKLLKVGVTLLDFLLLLSIFHDQALAFLFHFELCNALILNLLHLLLDLLLFALKLPDLIFLFLLVLLVPLLSQLPLLSIFLIHFVSLSLLELLLLLQSDLPLVNLLQNLKLSFHLSALQILFMLLLLRDDALDSLADPLAHAFLMSSGLLPVGIELDFHRFERANGFQSACAVFEQEGRILLLSLH